MKDINFFRVQDSIYLKKISSKVELSDIEDYDGYLLDADEKETRRIIDTLKGKKKIIAVFGRDNLFNRRAIETLKIDYLVSPERELKKDSLKQRDSGLNHIVAKEAAKKNISIVIDLSEIINLKGKQRALRLQKIIQNIVICRRAKCSIKIANFSYKPGDVLDERARQALGTSLGMSSKQSKDSTKFSP